MKYSILALTLATASAANLKSPSYYEQQFNQWKKSFGVKFETAEEEDKRMAVFADADDIINLHNAKNTTYTVSSEARVPLTSF